jgi:hypothetical protein
VCSGVTLAPQATAITCGGWRQNSLMQRAEALELTILGNLTCGPKTFLTSQSDRGRTGLCFLLCLSCLLVCVTDPSHVLMAQSELTIPTLFFALPLLISRHPPPPCDNGRDLHLLRAQSGSLGAIPEPLLPSLPPNLCRSARSCNSAFQIQAKSTCFPPPPPPIKCKSLLPPLQEHLPRWLPLWILLQRS